MGKRALPALLAQAAAPVIGAVLIACIGADATCGVLAATAIADLGMTGVVIAGSRRTRRKGRGAAPAGR